MDYKTISDFLAPLGLIAKMELGEGGFGKVWKVQAKIGGNITVFKTISIGEFKRKRGINSEQDMQKILHEVTVGQILKHNPHIVHVYNCWIHGPLKDIYEPMLKHINNKNRVLCQNVQDLFQSDTSGNPVVSQEDKNTFLVIQMEYCDTDLAKWIKNNPLGSPTRTNETITEIFSQILDGLQYMHDKNVIHRDLKPCNIFITICQTDNKICCKIGDFGLARLVPRESEHFSVRIGTCSYRSPEMDGLIDVQIDQKTDIFSAAFILLELLYDYKNINKRKRDFVDIIHLADKFSQLFERNQFPNHYDLLLKMFSRLPASRPTALKCKRLLLSSSSVEKPLPMCNEPVPSGSKQLVLASASGNSLFPLAESGDILVEPNLIFFGVTSSVYNFSGRDQEIATLQQIFHSTTKYALVCGLGGIGKTELVKKFANISSKENHVTLLNGDTSSSLIMSIGDLAGYLEIQISNEDKKDELKMLEKIGKRLKDRKWLMIIDNVDDIHQKFESVIRFTINICNIFVVVTSQSRSVLDEQAELIAIGNLLPEDALKLVTKSLQTEKCEQIESLCTTLQYFPLALQQAVAYIIKRKRRSLENFGIQEYLKEFESKKMKLFESKPGITNAYGKTIFITWNLTLERIQNHKEIEFQQAVDIMNVLAFMNPDNLPTEFLYQMYLLASISTASANEENKSHFTYALETLKDYSIIKVENNIISLHRILQELILFGLDENAKNEILETIITNVTIKDLNKSEMKQLLHVWEHIQERPELFKKQTDCLIRIKKKLMDLLLKHEYLRFSESNHKLFKEILGKDDVNSLRSEEVHAGGLMNVGKYKEALEMYEKVLPKIKRVFGNKHEATLNTTNNMALTLSKLKRYPEALKIYFELLKVEEEKFGKHNQSTMITKHNIGAVLQEQGKYSEAMELYNQVLGWQRMRLGDHHESTLCTREHIAMCFYDQGKYDEAKTELGKVLALKKDHLGETHPDFLKTKHDFAMAFGKIL